MPFTPTCTDSMAPVKFDDLTKTAKDVLSDDYTDAAKNVATFKSKMKTNFEGVNSLTGAAGKDGATLTTAVDLNLGDKIATPAKLTWKFPAPLGIAGLSFDKLEMDKSGKVKLESILDLEKMQNIAGLKIDCKTDLNANLAGTTLGGHYTGVANSSVKFNINVEKLVKVELQAPKAYDLEVTYGVGSGATVGVKHTPDGPLDVGVQYVNGPAFFAAMVSENFAAQSFHGFYKASDNLKLAANYNLGGKKTDGQFSAGLAYNVCEGTHFKAKVSGKAGADLVLGTVLKQHLAKGVTMTAGANVPLNSADKAMTWGLAFNIE